MGEKEGGDGEISRGGEAVLIYPMISQRVTRKCNFLNSCLTVANNVSTRRSCAAKDVKWMRGLVCEMRAKATKNTNEEVR